MSQGELVHPKALPLIVGAQLIHADKLGEVGADIFLKLTLGSVLDFRLYWVLLVYAPSPTLGNLDCESEKTKSTKFFSSLLSLLISKKTSNLLYLF